MFFIISRRFHFALYSPSLLYVLFFSSMCFSGFPNVNYTYREKLYTIFFFWIKVCVFLTFLICLHNQLRLHIPLLKSTNVWKKKINQIDKKMNCCSFHQDLQQKLSWFFSSHRKALFIEVSFSIQEKEGRFF